jgi:type IV secretion system protein VirD4
MPTFQISWFVIGECLVCALAAFLGARGAARPFLKARMKALVKEERKRKLQAALDDRERQNKELVRQEKDRRDAADLSRRTEERLQGEVNQLQEIVLTEYHEHWTYASNNLLAGCVVANLLHGMMPPPREQHLRPTYDQSNFELPIWFEGQAMGVTIGAAGSGKFTAAIAPNVLTYDGSCFIIDPKGEVCAVTGTARKQKHRQNVYRLDPFEDTKFDPGVYQALLSSYNPLDALNPGDLRFPDHVASLVEALIPPGQGGADRFWEASAKELLKAVIMFVRTHPDSEEDRTLYKVYEYLNPDGAKKDWLFEQMALSSFDAVRLVGNTHGAMPEKMRDGIWQHARTELAIFASPAIRNVTSHSSFRLEELFEGGCTLYIVLPAEYLESHNRWLRLMMTVSLMMATRYKNNRVGKRMLWIVDEAAQLGRLDIIPVAYRLLRGYGVRIWTFWQNLQDIKSTYPEHWTALIANSFVQLMSCGDVDTAEYFVKYGGEDQFEKISHSVQEGYSWMHTDSESHSQTESTNKNETVTPGVGTTPGSKSYSSGSGHADQNGTGVSDAAGGSRQTGVTRSLEWETIFRVNHLLAMRNDEMFLRFPGERAGIVKKHFYHNNEYLNELADPNPYHDPVSGTRMKPPVIRPYRPAPMKGQQINQPLEVDRNPRDQAQREVHEGKYGKGRIYKSDR